VLGLLVTGEWQNLSSAYISGISVAILVRAPALWPYVLCSMLSITSKYVLRRNDQHLWNPSNFGICALLFLAPFAAAPLSVQWGNNLWPMLAIWMIGLFTIWRLKRAHITLTYIGAFLALAGVRSWVGGEPYLATVAPITGPMYQLFALFMITDPKTTVSARWGEAATAGGVAVVEMGLRFAEVVYAPFYALFLVGPAAMLIEQWWTARTASDADSVPADTSPDSVPAEAGDAAPTEGAPPPVAEPASPAPDTADAAAEESRP
jgi:Na+-transporting NADH:ubiquinone oxidoreductase subunit NqrB